MSERNDPLSGLPFEMKERLASTLKVECSGEPSIDAQIRKARRDAFAAKAMQGLLSGELVTVEAGQIAHDAVVMADALLAALEEPKGDA